MEKIEKVFSQGEGAMRNANELSETMRNANELNEIMRNANELSETMLHQIMKTKEVEEMINTIINKDLNIERLNH